MKITVRKTTAALLATGLFAFSSAAMATNGYFTHGVGTESKAMAGSGVGSTENMGGIAAATNPALAVFSDDKWQVGLSIFSPARSYEVAGGLGGQQGTFSLSNGEYDSKNDVFPIPYVAKNWTFSNGHALSVLFYGRGGMNTEWDSGQSVMTDPTGQGGNPVELPGLYGGGKAGVDLMQAFLNINYAMKIGDNFSLGFGPVIAAQTFEATGLAMFTGYTQTFADAFLGNGQGAPAPNLTNNGHDTAVGYGLSVGMWAGNDKMSFGLAYQSKIDMGEFEDYSDLYAKAGDFDIPSTIKAGVSFRTSDSVNLNFDVEHIGYSDIDSVGNPIMNLLTGCFTANPGVAPETSGCLGGPNGAGFGWEDMTVYKLGVSVKSSDRNTWRFGYSYGEQPIPSSEMLFNILAPGVMEQHFTVGWTGERPNGNIMSVSFMYAPESRVSGPNTFDPFQTIELTMSQLDLEFAYRF
jgi:long-chain fatty acid transport protein